MTWREWVGAWVFSVAMVCLVVGLAVVSQKLGGVAYALNLIPYGILFFLLKPQ